MQPAPFWYRYIEKSIVCAFFFVVPLIVGLLVPYFLLRESIYRIGMTEKTMDSRTTWVQMTEVRASFHPWISGTMPGWFSPVSSISTGLLFGVSLLHLIPDCTTDMQNALERIGCILFPYIARRSSLRPFFARILEPWKSANVRNVYPVTMLLISTGFFIVTLVEILVSRCRKNKEVPLALVYMTKSMARRLWTHNLWYIVYNSTQQNRNISFR